MLEGRFGAPGDGRGALLLLQILCVILSCGWSILEAPIAAYYHAGRQHRVISNNILHHKTQGGWCSFGCAAHQMDPLHKFRDSGDDRWNFDGIDFDACCGPDGFLRDKPGCECSVKPRRDPASCPQSPYYTDR